MPGRKQRDETWFLPAELWLDQAELMKLWRFYNGEYLVAYAPAQERDVHAALGTDIRAAANWRRLKRIGEQNVRARPDDPYHWWGLGKANLRLGNVQTAAANFDRQRLRSPLSPEPVVECPG